MPLESTKSVGVAKFIVNEVAETEISSHEGRVVEVCLVVEEVALHFEATKLGPPTQPFALGSSDRNLPS